MEEEFELKRCPFCGAEASYTGYFASSIVECDRCGASMEGGTIEQTINAWNRRVVILPKTVFGMPMDRVRLILEIYKLKGGWGDDYVEGFKDGAEAAVNEIKMTVKQTVEGMVTTFECNPFAEFAEKYEAFTEKQGFKGGKKPKEEKNVQNKKTEE